MPVIDAENDRRVAAIDLVRAVRVLAPRFLLEPQPLEHPGDRRLLLASPGAPIEPETIRRSLARVIAT